MDEYGDENCDDSFYGNSKAREGGKAQLEQLQRHNRNIEQALAEEETKAAQF